MMRRAIFAILALLAGAAPASAARPTFLYIATGPPFTKHWTVSRFALSNGMPARTPDRVYHGAGGQIALGADGTLYAQSPEQTPGELRVAAFDRGAQTPSRTIVLPAAPGCSATRTIDALATDANGDLAVAVDAGRTSHRVNARCWGVFVFAPGASGNARPINTIALPQFEFGLTGGNGTQLVVTDYPAASLFVFNDVTRERTPTATLRNPYPLTVVRDSGGLDVFDNAAGSARVYVLGHDAPLQPVLLLQQAQVLCPSIAIYGTSIYIVENLLHQVLLYPKDGNGPVDPSARYSTIKHVTDIAIGW